MIMRVTTKHIAAKTRKTRTGKSQTLKMLHIDEKNCEVFSFYPLKAALDMVVFTEKC